MKITSEETSFTPITVVFETQLEAEHILSAISMIAQSPACYALGTALCDEGIEPYETEPDSEDGRVITSERYS